MNQAEEPPASEEIRRAMLAQRIQSLVPHGYRVESQSDYQAVLVRGNRINHLLHLVLTLLTFGLWVFVWIVLAIHGGEKRKVVSIDDYGQALESGH